MPQRNTSHAEASAFAHATEDLTKVRSAILKILPEQIASEIELTQTSMQGHHGNPIVEIKANIRNREEAYEVLRGILSRLSPVDEALLDKEFTNHLDTRHHFYLRLDKQRAFLGETILASDDAISLIFRLRFLPKSLDDLKAGTIVYRDHGGRN